MSTWMERSIASHLRDLLIGAQRELAAQSPKIEPPDSSSLGGSRAKNKNPAKSKA